MKLLRGKGLRAGDAVGVIAPSSGFDPAALSRGIAALEGRGFRVKRGTHLDARADQYFAGTAQQRADDLHAMFADNDVAAVLCARGGYGSQSLLPLLEFDLIRANPKPMVGCSDITALQLLLLDRCGLVSLHGPMIAGDFARDNGVDDASWHACISGTSGWKLGAESGLQTLQEGAASGMLWGGCLSLLVSSLATPFELLPAHGENILLFVEDVGEKPYKIERMMQQWRAAGKMERVKGIIFGEMLACEQPGSSYQLTDVLRRMFHDFDGPVAYGLRSGHVSRHNVTLPLGASAALECGENSDLTFHNGATLPA